MSILRSILWITRAAHAEDRILADLAHNASDADLAHHNASALQPDVSMVQKA